MNRVSLTFLYILFFPFAYVGLVYGIYGLIDWFGVVVDTSSAVTAFTQAGFALWFLGAILAALGVFSATAKPIRASKCQSCGYDLSTISKQTCPECGHSNG